MLFAILLVLVLVLVLGFSRLFSSTRTRTIGQPRPSFNPINSINPFNSLSALLLLLTLTHTPAATLSDPEVDRYNVRVGTQTFAGLYKFTTNTLLVETAQAITNMGSDIIKFYMGHNTSGQSGVTLGANITNLLTLARDELSYHHVLDMPFRHFVIWEYPFANPDAPFQDGNYTSTEQANDYREMYDLTHYLLTNYNNSAKSFFLGHWEGDGYLNVNNWTTNPSPAVVSNMIIWENTRQKAVDDAKAATAYSNVSVYYYAEANRVRDAMLNGTNNNVRMIDSVIPYVTNLDYVSYSSYDAMNLSTSDLYTTLDYMEAHLPTNKLSAIHGERIWIGEYGWGGSQTTDQQEPTTRAYIQRLLNYGQKAFPHILFWEMYDNEVGKLFCLIDSNNVKVASWYLHQRYINSARLFTAQFKERNGRVPTDSEFVSIVTPMLNQPLPAPVNLTVSNLGASLLSTSSASVSGTLAQGVYGDDRATVWVYWGRQDGGSVRSAWEQSQRIAVNTNFNPATFTTTITNLAPQTNYFFRFYATNASGEAWAPSSAQFGTAALNPPDFNYRLKVAFTGYNRDETLLNFPMLVNFSTNLPGFSYSQFASRSGGDLRFTDATGLVLIPHEIDEWNTNGASSVWVNLPALSSTNDFIWAYWGNPSDTTLPTSSTNGAVWSANHDLVWHLKETGFPYADSAEQFPALSGVTPTLTGGIIGHGELFNGSSQYLDAGPINLGNAFTVSAWVKVDPTVNNIQSVWANKPGGFQSNGFALFVNSYQTNDGRLILETGNGTAGASIQSGIGAVPFGQWHRVTAVMDRAGGNAQLYVDGVQLVSGGIRTDFMNQSDENLARFTNSNFYFKGAIDEARVESAARSSNWVWASWMTVAGNSTLATYSPVNPQPTLSLVSSPSGPLLTWPASAGIFTLYTATNLTPPATWLPVTNSPTLVSNQWQFPLEQTGADSQFYRLQAQ
jgi:hypothetical protein